MVADVLLKGMFGDRKLKILILGATFSTGNLGVGALAAGALTIVARRYPKAELCLLDYGRQATISQLEVGGKQVKVPLINLRFSWKLLLPNNVALLILLAAVARLLTSGLRKRVIRRNRWLAAVDEADLALAVSGGDSFSDMYGLNRLLYVALPQVLIAVLGKRLIFLPQTIGPFDGRFARLIGSALLRRASLVFSRDAEALREVRRLRGNDADSECVRFCHDMGFVVEPHEPRAEDLGGLVYDKSSPLVGLNVSGLLLMGGYTRSNMFGLKANYVDLVDRLIELFIDERKTRVVLVPHVFSDDAESDATAIQTVLDRFGNRYPCRLFAVKGNYDQNEIKYIIGHCSFFVGSRMHACIAALAQCIPSIGVAYSDKFAGVFSSVGLANLVVDPRKLTVEQASGVIARAFDERAAIRLQLEQQMPGVKNQVLGLLDKFRVVG